MTCEKTYASPRWSGELADCSMPMTFDQYNNCGFSCVYCFSQYQRALGGAKSGYVGRDIKAVKLEKFKKIFEQPESSQFGEYVKQRKVMQWGGLSDPFCHLERKLGAGLELLRYLRSIDYPVCFSTKGTWWLDDARYAELFKDNPKWNVKFSIITLDAEKAAAIERGVRPPLERIAAMEKLVKLNAGGATLRLRPFIIGVSNPQHQELIKLAGAAGATAITTEFFCLERRSTYFKTKGLPVIKEQCGFDILEFYAKFSSGSGYLRLNRNIKRPFVDEMEAAAKQAGMRFYVSDAHFKERCSNGCCCGLPPTWNYSRGQFAEALVLCKKNGRVTWDEIAEGATFLTGIKWVKAEGFNTNSAEKRARFQRHSLLDYMRWLWNNPNAGQSPYTMFGGIMKPASKDANGNLVYEYDPTRA